MQFEYEKRKLSLVGCLVDGWLFLFCSYRVCFRFQLKLYWQFYFTISDFALFFLSFLFFGGFTCSRSIRHRCAAVGVISFYLHDKSRLNPSWVNRFLLLLTISLIGFVIFMLEIEMILAILLNEIDVASAVSVVTQAHTLDAVWLLCGSMVTVCERARPSSVSMNTKWRWAMVAVIFAYSVIFLRISFFFCLVGHLLYCFCRCYFFYFSPFSGWNIDFHRRLSDVCRVRRHGGKKIERERARARCGQNAAAKKRAHKLFRARIPSTSRWLTTLWRWVVVWSVVCWCLLPIGVCFWSVSRPR